MEEKLVINELEQGKELANRLMANLKHSSSMDSNKILISQILRIYQNAILMLSFNEDDKNSLKRSLEIGSSKTNKKRKVLEKKKTEKVKVFVGTGQEKGPIDDGYCWRKYGQKEIHGSNNPRGYYRCTHRFTQSCLAVKQVQKSDTDPSVYEVKYLGSHTCCNNSNNNNNNQSPNFSVSVFESGNRIDVTEEDVKPKITEEVFISLEDLENKKNIFRTFSFSDNEIKWENNIFSENLMKDLSPATSGSGITSEIVTAPVENSETADSYFSNLDSFIDLGQDWLWS